MTPKEKATELINKMYSKLPVSMHAITVLAIAKTHALISVDEILSLCWNGNEVAKKYWQEVKQEIEKL